MTGVAATDPNSTWAKNYESSYAFDSDDAMYDCLLALKLMGWGAYEITVSPKVNRSFTRRKAHLHAWADKQAHDLIEGLAASRFETPITLERLRGIKPDSVEKFMQEYESRRA